MGRKEEYLRKALQKLNGWLPYVSEELLNWYLGEGGEDAVVEETNGYVYVLFCLPVLTGYGDYADIGDGAVLEKIILLVFDGDTVIADCSGLHADALHFLTDEYCVEYISEESDWSYLSAYTLNGVCFAECGNAYEPQSEPALRAPEGEILILNNAYVTKAYRRQGIFTIMLAMMKEASLRETEGTVTYYTVMSLDPDVPVYGPDATDEPYYYSYERDEPKRMENKEILEHMNWLVLRLEEAEPEKNSAGDKLWYGIYVDMNVISVAENIT